MSFHKDEVGSSLHNLQAFTYADAATRLAGAGLVSADIGKVAKQTDTNRYYILLSIGPVLWSEITAPSNGSGGVNYAVNTNAEDSAAPWATYADVAGVAPVDGTGGVANITITRSTVSPLRGSASFLITKDAVNRQGQGASLDMAIDSVDQSKALSISFDYAPGTGFVAGSDSVNSDILVYIYDITNAQLITPTATKLTTAAGFNGSYSGSFQSNSNSTSYRLILHIATTNAAAWTFKFDNVRVGPGVGVVTGVPASDWVSYTPTISGLGAGSSTNIARYRRVGDSIEISFSIVKDATPGSGAAEVTMSLPPGLTVDSTKIGGTSDRTVVGAAQFITSAFLTTITSTIVSNAASVIKFGNNTTGNSFTGADFPATRTILGEARIPITGWSSNVVFSNDSSALGSIVAANAYRSGAAQVTVAAVELTIIAQTERYDTLGAYNNATGIFTAPVSGYYYLHGQAHIIAGGTPPSQVQCHWRKNGGGALLGVMVKTPWVASENFTMCSDALVQLNAGDTLAFTVLSTGQPVTVQSTGGDNDDTAININRISSGASTVAQTDTIAARYVTSAGQNQVSGVNTTVVFGTKDFDTHGAMNSSTGIFTAPVAGVYDVFSVITWGTATFTAGDLIEMDLYKNGALHSTMFFATHANTSAIPKSMNGAATVKLNAGDTININILQNDTGARALTTTSTLNWVSIKRVGN